MAKLLIIHQGALGDFVATFPAIIRLKKRFCRTDVLCQSKLGKLACELDIADQYFPLEAASFSSLYSDAADPRVQNILRTYHEIVLFSYSEQLGQTINKITHKKAYLIHPRADVHQRIHITEHILSHLVKCGLADPLPPVSEGIFSSVFHRDRREKQYDPARILIHPGSGGRKKFWHLSNFTQVETALRSDRFMPEFILGPAEHFLAKSLQDHQNRIVHTISDLTELVSLLKIAGGFIGNDSGVSHLAAFMGLPAVAVFGPSDPERWRPVGRAVSVVRPADLDCSPCFELTHQKTCDKQECFDRTSPETVLGVFYELWQKNLKNHYVV
ncbi:glycosyltransferase family 9 protein [Desulfonema magnum]|uniref:Glycosyltransferase protein, family 9 n=1 Tax=Desulfonema magnum TaxID=45655 RepID=A0A975BWK3_9BACT|nr:glycosyltransferase family 9 protein [Desulfonema magnum]QTA92470.1 Glycosyltransferase protein, family 9 [Desulfonema magnum]